MKRIWWFSGALAAIGTVAAVASWIAPSPGKTPPKGAWEGFSTIPLPPGVNLWAFAGLLAAFRQSSPGTAPSAQLQAIAAYQAKEYKKRFDLLPGVWMQNGQHFTRLPNGKFVGPIAEKDAALPSVDSYSKQKFPALAREASGWRIVTVDQFGRRWDTGTGSNLFQSALSVAQFALPMVPGIGPAAGAALSATIAIGQGKSLKDIGMASVRGALPPWGQVAFDLGVGVVIEKRQPDAVAVDAFFRQYPEAKAAYIQGQSMAKTSGGA